MEIKTEKIFIKNRKNQKVCVLVEKPEKSVGLAFVTHGRGGFKEQSYVRTIASSLLNNNYIIISFETTNSLGESESSFSDATLTNYYEDLEDVIDWSKSQTYYQEPFVLCGHSIGSMSIILYAEHYPQAIKALAPISTGVSGRLSYEAFPPETIAESSIGSSSRITKKLKWSHMEDLLKYDLLEGADKLVMPVLLAVGEFDKTHPLSNQEKLFKALPGSKELRIIKGAAHTFKKPEHLEEVYSLMDKWLKSLT
ncbi:MAG: alpha/beta hydrolase [Candidatus Falkowbacteria bacterium]|nr:alpha/beta hydrolase [Candidatus Falkowbacteria bacterium]